MVAVVGCVPIKVLRGQASSRDSVALIRRIIAAEESFFSLWLAAWKKSEGERHPVIPTGDPRGSQVHCHFEASTPATELVGYDPVIMSRGSRFTVCASYLRDGELAPDERLHVDSALTPSHRQPIRGARQRLLELLDSASRILPGDRFIVGQRVRLTVDQQDDSAALQAARRCKATVPADASWCAALEGFVLTRLGDVVGADSAFRRSITVLPINERCRWTDVRALLEQSARAQYEKLSCTARDSVSAVILWLADPLFSRPGNERLVDHFYRRVLLNLRMAPGRDERFDWRYRTGNDAREDLVIRYGWPTYIYWNGDPSDNNHSGYLAERGSPDNVPYAAYQFSSGSVHLLPSPRAVGAPFSADERDWNVSEPRAPAANGATWPWWPIEHSRPHFPLVQLPDVQVGMLRRDSSVILAAAADLPARAIGRWSGTAVDSIALVTTHHPDSVILVARAAGASDATVLVSGHIVSRPTVASLEFPSGSYKEPAGRVRLGIHPPAPLAAMQQGEHAVSNPIVLFAPLEGALPPHDPPTALRQMAGSTTIAPERRFAVYWETYGFGAKDTLELAVWIERFTRDGVFRRLGQSLRLTEDRNTPVVVSWTEPQSTSRIHEVASTLQPIIGRSLTLDVSALPAGDYWIEVAVRKKGHETVRGRTAITIR
jgi:hypothetical protein